MRPSDDFYAQLEVGRDASGDAIRSAYRRLARRYHPDVNPGDAGASRRFAQLNEAYDVLSDPDKRSLYDRTGRVVDQNPRGPAPTPRRPPPVAATSAPAPGLWRRLAALFGSANGRGTDLRQAISLSLADAVNGATVAVDVQRPGGANGAGVETIRVRVPAGIQAGGVVRVPGKGLPGRGGAAAAAGDLFLVAEVLGHEDLRPVGKDLHASATISVWTAMTGGSVDVPTLDGVTTIRIPAGSQAGQRFRLRGRGGRDGVGAELGDQIVELSVTIPALGDERLSELIDGLRAIAEASPATDEPATDEKENE